MSNTITTETNQVIKFYEPKYLMTFAQKHVGAFIRKGYLIQDVVKNEETNTFDFSFVKDGEDTVTLGYVHTIEHFYGHDFDVVKLVKTHSVKTTGFKDEVLKSFYVVNNELFVANRNVIRKFDKVRTKRQASRKPAQYVDVTTPETIDFAKTLKGFRTVARKNIAVRRILNQPKYLITNKTNNRNKRVVTLTK